MPNIIEVDGMIFEEEEKKERSIIMEKELKKQEFIPELFKKESSKVIFGIHKHSANENEEGMPIFEIIQDLEPEAD